MFVIWHLLRHNRVETISRQIIMSYCSNVASPVDYLLVALNSQDLSQLRLEELFPGIVWLATVQTNFIVNSTVAGTD